MIEQTHLMEVMMESILGAELPIIGTASISVGALA
jgi:hypothetical protein